MLGLVLSLVILQSETKSKVITLTGLWWPTWLTTLTFPDDFRKVEIDFMLQEERVVWQVWEYSYYSTKYSVRLSTDYYTFHSFIDDLKRLYSILQNEKLPSTYEKYGTRLSFRELSYGREDEYGRKYFGWEFSVINLGKKYEPKWAGCLDLVMPSFDIYGRKSYVCFSVYLYKDDIEKFLKKLKEVGMYETKPDE